MVLVLEEEEEEASNLNEAIVEDDMNSGVGCRALPQLGYYTKETFIW